jgi:hypothetical protein
MKASEIRKILKLARQFGVKEMTMGGFAVSFHAPKRVKKKAKKVATSTSLQGDHSAATPEATLEPQEPIELTSEGLPTHDELLLMSTPFYDQMQELKRLQDAGDASDETQSIN